MTAAPARPHRNGFTLVELLVVVAVAVILLTIAAPSMRELIVRQRLKSVNAELVTDLQYARTLAVSRNVPIVVSFMHTPAMSCYVLFVPSAIGGCDCTNPPGSACPVVPGLGGSEELRTTQVLSSTDVQITNTPPNTPPQGLLIFTVDGMQSPARDYKLMTSRVSGSSGQLLVTVNPAGRPSVCTPDSSVPGVPGCP
jgi:type IV fimbrial biogenesis protein FimT